MLNAEIIRQQMLGFIRQRDEAIQLFQRSVGAIVALEEQLKLLDGAVDAPVESQGENDGEVNSQSTEQVAEF